jgi:hypothetical protein
VKEVSDVLHVSLLRIQFHDLFLVDHAVKGAIRGRIAPMMLGSDNITDVHVLIMDNFGSARRGLETHSSAPWMSHIMAPCYDDHDAAGQRGLAA